ncbi:hypothetical protein D7Y11_32845 [Corallococcus sp. AB018]|uniref:hypothetical protein n=1 Tax=Corallococcus sp. AB018 TaxID=2316715 RepID=UPI000F8936D6|nr:hypothetical protein [Corallococcus sp. AB018]RUO88942.1 hypothetical protein D7Y11_32845 [Corallococcus sp. AB018]
MHPHPASRIPWRASALALLCINVACDSLPAAEPSPPTPLATSEARLDPPTQFTDVAFVGTAACSNDYSRIDNCYNAENPQRPSIFRELSAAWRPYRDASTTPLSVRPSALTGVMQPFPPFEYDNGWSAPRTPETADASQAIQVMPFNRGSNDGRLFVRGGCRGCAEGSTLYTFRPELLGPDFRYDFAQKGTRYVQPTWQPGLHPFVAFNPMPGYSRLAAKNNNDFPDMLHSTLCEDSVSSLNAGGRGRNPLACRARYESTSPWVSGDCYDISLVYGMVASDGKRWELRSTALTVFVRNPKLATAGDSVGGGVQNWGLWVYPRNPEGESKSLPTWDLPPFRPFNVHDSNWGDMSTGSTYSVPGAPDTIDWIRLFTQNASFQCYVPKKIFGFTYYVRNTAATAPKWCQFFDRQSFAGDLKVEDDEDAVIGNGSTWNGVIGNGPDEKHLAMFEPATSGDGRMLILNMGGLFYASSDAICQAATWSHFKPISMMPMDPAVNTRYELARSQVINGQPRNFRDTMGNPIPFGVRNQGAYAWLDREGKNLFFAAKNNPHDGYYARKVAREDRSAPVSYLDELWSEPASDADRARFNPDRAPAQAISVLGAWTHGKAVILDNGMSITDLGGNSEDRYQRTYSLRLYAGADLPLSPKGSSQLFSFENQLNTFNALRPTLPFDVVWNFQSNTQRNSEVAFDDYLNKRAFVVAHMNAAMRMDVSPEGPLRAETFPQDGFMPTRNAWAYVRGGDIADFKFMRNPLAQNAATGSPLFGTDGPQPPASVRLRGGARIEPVALGGVSGKGVWLDGRNDFMDMGYPVDGSRRDWLFGIWLDSRMDPPFVPRPGGVSRTVPRTLFYFSDNSWVGLVQAVDGSSNTWHELTGYNGQTGSTFTVNLGSLVQPGKYFHFGMKVYTLAGQRKLTFYINGTAHSSLTVAPYDVGFDPMYNSMNGWTWMTVGDPGPNFVQGQTRLPFHGWVDELRIYALSPGDIVRPWVEELLCNQALGTTVDLTYRPPEVYSPVLETLRSRSVQYPLSSGRALCEQLRLGSYVEPLDYPAQSGEHLCIDRVHKNPHSVQQWRERCLRTSMMAMPHLEAALPRPDSSSNAFCQSCHTSSAPLPGLRMGALTAGGVNRYQDPRRQPMNVPAVLGGTVPPWLLVRMDQPDGTFTLDHHFDWLNAP